MSASRGQAPGARSWRQLSRASELLPGLRRGASTNVRYRRAARATPAGGRCEESAHEEISPQTPTPKPKSSRVKQRSYRPAWTAPVNSKPSGSELSTRLSFRRVRCKPHETKAASTSKNRPPHTPYPTRRRAFGARLHYHTGYRHCAVVTPPTVHQRR